MKKIAFLSILLSIVFVQVFAQNPVRKIEVVGFASQEVSPDIVYMSFTLKEYEANKRTVSLEESEKELKSLLASLKIPLENLVVSNVFGYVSYEPDGKKGTYQNRKSYRLKLSDMKKINALAAGLNENSIENLHMDELSHSAIKTYEKEVRIKALEAAKEKAGYLLASMNAQLGNVLEIQELDYNFYQPRPMYNMKADLMATEMGADVIESQNIKVEYKIRVVFEIK